VGYTNAGKSTLLNAMTGSAVLTENKLFATLDPTSRRLRFPQEQEDIVTDTVGFIRDLPKDLVNAFRATLEELSEADLLLHVVDASDDAHESQLQAVEAVLEDLGLLETPRLLAWNKSDLVPAEESDALLRTHGGVAVSAARRQGLEELLAQANRMLFLDRKIRL
jgi:GTP-binding protein HflX